MPKVSSFEGRKFQAGMHGPVNGSRPRILRKKGFENVCFWCELILVSEIFPKSPTGFGPWITVLWKSFLS